MTISAMASPRRTALHVLLLATTLAVPLAAAFTPIAHAEGGRDERHEDRRDRDWDSRGRREGYYRRPDLYYSAPPVMVVHPDYYRQPAPGISFQLPFFYR